MHAGLVCTARRTPILDPVKGKDVFKCTCALVVAELRQEINDLLTRARVALQSARAALVEREEARKGEYGVIAVLDERVRKGALEYYVDWEGEDPKTGERYEPTWIEAKNLGEGAVKDAHLALKAELKALEPKRGRGRPSKRKRIAVLALE
jgi:hypothetical protein